MTCRALCGKLFENWKADGRRASFGEPMRNETGHEEEVLRRITVDPKIFGGKPIIRGRRLAVEHVLGMLAAGDSLETDPGRIPLAGTRRYPSVSHLRQAPRWAPA